MKGGLSLTHTLKISKRQTTKKRRPQEVKVGESLEMGVFLESLFIFHAEKNHRRSILLPCEKKNPSSCEKKILCP
jgi:hypothetical protein